MGVPFNIVVCIIVAQCLFNLLGIFVLSNENKKKDKVIAKMAEELNDKAFLIRTYKRLLESKEAK